MTHQKRESQKQETKECPGCGRVMPIESFGKSGARDYLHGGFKPHGYCADCRTPGKCPPGLDGRWKGGRYYLDELGRRVFFIESNRPGIPRMVKLKTFDEELALGELARFRQDPHAFCAPPPAPPEAPKPLYITSELINLYLASKRLRKACDDHRKARSHYLVAWSEKQIDLRTVDRKTLRTKLAEFDGGHNGRAEALNAFARFLIKEKELDAWTPLECEHDPKKTRAERVAYSLDELRECYQRQARQDVKDILRIRVSTGMHFTEIEQLKGARVYNGPMPDIGVGIRVLKEGDSPISGVIQFRQKTKPRHRVSVTKDVLDAALRLRQAIPDRELVWEKLKPLVPSNLRHTYITLAGEEGQWITYTGRGVPLDLIQQVVGHRIGSKVTQSNYDKLQVPPMILLPLQLDILEPCDGDLAR